MKIVCIFAKQLYAFHYKDEIYNEFDRNMDLWTDPNYLSEFGKKNKLQDVYVFVDEILQDAQVLENLLDDVSQRIKSSSSYFEALDLSEYDKKLPFQKGKIRFNKLRFYAIKIDVDCYVITGGAIKMSQKMEDHPDTANELLKLKAAREFLNSNGVFDDGSFYELLAEQNENE
jgi:hypothetical protein